MTVLTSTFIDTSDMIWAAGYIPAPPGLQDGPVKVKVGKDAEDQDQENVPPPPPAAKGSELLKKTQMCRFAARGMCTRGEKCTFAHYRSELRTVPNLSRTKICLALRKDGRCLDPGCLFAHKESQLRRPVESMPFAPEPKAVILPRYPANWDVTGNDWLEVDGFPSNFQAGASWYSEYSEYSDQSSTYASSM